jgi:hypothetical protein
MNERRFNMGKILIIIGITLGLACSSTPMWELTEQVRIQNREKLTHLSVGMTKSEVLQIMGTKTIELKTFDAVYMRNEVQRINNPYRVEAIQNENGETYEVLFYYTDRKKADGVVTDDELMPLVIKDDKLIGWGWTFVNDNISKYQIDVRQ